MEGYVEMSSLADLNVDVGSHLGLDNDFPTKQRGGQDNSRCVRVTAGPSCCCHGGSLKIAPLLSHKTPDLPVGMIAIRRVLACLLSWIATTCSWQGERGREEGIQDAQDALEEMAEQEQEQMDIEEVEEMLQYYHQRVGNTESEASRLLQGETQLHHY